MRTTVTLKIDITHDEDYDPVDHFVWYFSDDAGQPQTFVVYEEWETQ